MIPDLRLGDWRRVLPGEYDPARAIVITDPPYGLNAPGGTASRSVGSHLPSADAIDKGYEDVIPWADHVREVLALLPAVRHVIRGPATLLIRRDFPQPRRLCVESATYRHRAANRPGTVPYLWQAWAVYGRIAIGRRNRPTPGDALSVRPSGDPARQRVAPTARQHRAQTPYASALWMVEAWADAGWTVIDPFAGLGTIGRAASALGLDYLGAEIDPEWHSAAGVRLEMASVGFGL